MAEKSPAVQPIRHRRVLMLALCHVGKDRQNCDDDSDDVAAALLGHSGFLLLPVHPDRRWHEKREGRSLDKERRVV